MQRSTIGVGIIGASRDKGGWAVTAHIPALPRNVGNLYAQFAKDSREGTQFVPDFVEATKRPALIDAIQLASDSGTRQVLG
jgi:hypothetical protein